MLRKLFFILTTAILIVAVFTGIVSALDGREPVGGSRPIWRTSAPLLRQRTQPA